MDVVKTSYYLGRIMDNHQYNLRIKELVQAWVNKKYKEQMEEIKELTELMNDVEFSYRPDIGCHDGIYDTNMAVAEWALDLFDERYVRADEYEDAMSDGWYRAESMQNMLRIEHKLLNLAAEIREKRLDVSNRRIVRLGEDYSKNYLED